MMNTYRFMMLALVVFFLLSACDSGLLKESTGLTGGVGAGLSEYQE
jgi:hypothetical protein